MLCSISSFSCCGINIWA